MKKQLFVAGMIGVALTFGLVLAGCASSPEYGFSPDELRANNQAKIVFLTGAYVGFDDEDGAMGKVNGIAIPKGEYVFHLDVDRTVNECMFIVNTSNRGIVGSKNVCVKASIDYRFTAGESYILQIHQQPRPEG